MTAHDTAAELGAALDAAKHLAEHGAPVFVARPALDEAGAWDPTGGHGGCGYYIPSGWQRFTADPSVLDTWRPGHGLAVVMGHAIDGLDVDPRHGGETSAAEWAAAGVWPRAYGRSRTPSGGWHDLVAPLRVASRDGALEGVDVKAGHAGAGHGFLWLPPTVRLSKSTGELTAYRWEILPDLDPLDVSGGVLAGRIEAMRAPDVDEGPELPHEAHEAMTEAQRAAVGRYLAVVEERMRAELVEPATWPEGHRDERQRGWQKLTADAANRLGRLARADWTPWSYVDARAVLGRVVPARMAAAVPLEHVWLAQRDRRGPAHYPESLAGGELAHLVDRRTPAAPRRAPSNPGADPRVMLGALLVDLRTWHHLPDPSHVVAALAAAVTRDAEGEPCWLLLVAPPSSGKTEAVRLLDLDVDERLDEVTAAGLLGWSKGKSARPSGVLARSHGPALVTFGDLSTLLATSDRGGRDVVFGMLRRVYDGHVTRDISPPGRTEGPDKLEWSGRLTVVAAVTGAIDRAAAHNDQLGPRWLYVRIPERSTSSKRTASRLARAAGLAERRRSAAEAAAVLLAVARSRLSSEVPPAVADVVEDAALVTAWGRAAVPRNGYGRREIEGVPVIEEPMRLVQQLAALARGLAALGMTEGDVCALVRRVALDSMPEARRAVLAALAAGGRLTTAGAARAAELHRHVARHQLEELAAVGVVENDRADDEDDEPAGVVHWSLSGDDGALIAAVFADANRAAVGWHELCEPIPPTPPRGAEESTPSRIRPTLRATPDDLDGGALTCPCGEPVGSMREAWGRTRCAACERAS